jgi:hypothetical protein
MSRGAVPPNKSLLRSGGQWYLVCKSLAGMDKLPMISLSEPPGAELSRYTAEHSEVWK